MPSSRPRHPVTGRRFYVHARTQRELDAYLHRIDRLREDLRLGVQTIEQVDRELRHLQHGPATLERACLAYLERPDLAKLTRARVRRAMGARLRPMLGKPLAALDVPFVSGWIRSMQTGRHGKLWSTTIATEWRTLRMVVRHAVERGWIAKLPWGEWRPKLSQSPKRSPREAARSFDELARLIVAARALDLEMQRSDPKLLTTSEPKIASMALLGLRQGELAGLRWPDVDWGPPLRVLIARQWIESPLKNKAPPRILEAVPALGAILRRYRDHLESVGLYDPAGPIFPVPINLPGSPAPYSKGEPLTRLQIRAAVERAQLPSLGAWSAHSLRDTFVTLETIASGGDLARVAARSRHGSLTSLARYLRASVRTPAPPSLLLLAEEGEGGAAPIAHASATEKEP